MGLQYQRSLASGQRQNKGPLLGSVPIVSLPKALLYTDPWLDLFVGLVFCFCFCFIFVFVLFF